MRRRSFVQSSLAAAGGLLPGVAATMPARAATAWSYDKYLSTMQACDRPTTLGHRRLGGRP